MLGRFAVDFVVTQDETGEWSAYAIELNLRKGGRPRTRSPLVPHGLHFDQSGQTGVVLHMISCLTELGRVGFTAVGDSPDQTWKLYERVGQVLLQEAATAATDWPLLP